MLAVDCVERLCFGWLLYLWYANCDIFSHLLALRLFKCVGVFGMLIFDDFSVFDSKKKITTLH